MQDASSENPGLTAHLDTILGHVEEKIASPETDFERGQHEKEALHVVVGEKLGKETVFTPVSASAHSDIASYDLPELKAKVDELLNIALSKDLDDAINQAKKADDPALLDAFHDALTDKLYNQLVAAGKLKQIK
jgi:hypothetical protein